MELATRAIDVGSPTPRARVFPSGGFDVGSRTRLAAATTGMQLDDDVEMRKRLGCIHRLCAAQIATVSAMPATTRPSGASRYLLARSTTRPDLGDGAIGFLVVR